MVFIHGGSFVTVSVLSVAFLEIGHGGIRTRSLGLKK